MYSLHTHQFYMSTPSNFQNDSRTSPKLSETGERTANRNLRYREKDNGVSSDNYELSNNRNSSRNSRGFGYDQWKISQKEASPDTCESDRSHRSDPPEDARITRGGHNKLKVELCKNYIARGYCPYENRCRFAHGLAELRTQAPQHSDLYRTRPCKTFHELGQCRFGDRCNFRHGAVPPRTELRGVRGQWCELFAQNAMEGVDGSSRLLSLLSLQPCDI